MVRATAAAICLGEGMPASRWERLFDDLEAQFAAEERRDVEAEVAERTRRERALVSWTDRIAAQGQAELSLEVAAGQRLTGRVADHGADWVLIELATGAEVLVSLSSVLAIHGLVARSREATTARRFGWGSVLRALARDRSAVEVVDRAGTRRIGTIDVVLSDAFELAEHALDVPRRQGNVTGRVVVPFAAVAMVRRR